MIGLREDQILEQRARSIWLTRLQVAEREVLVERRVARKFAHQLFVDLDGARVEAETKVHHRQKILALGVARLELERLLELLFCLVNAVVL